MAAADQIVFRFPRDRISDRSSLTVVARFRDRATDAEVTPTTVTYRLDNVTSGAEVADWTAATPGTTASIVTTPDNNEHKVSLEWQQMRLTVAADRGLSTQYNESFDYWVRDLGLRAHP